MGISGGDATAVFNKIYDSTTQAALAFITAKCGNMEDVSDILQETYMEVYSTLCNKGSDFIDNDEAFVINIAKRKIYKHYTNIQRAKEDLSLSVITNDNGEINLDLQPDEMDIEDSLCTNELVEEIWKIINKKPQDIQRIFFLRFSLDLSIKEISELMEIKESQIKNKLYRTINEIRQLYKEKGDSI